MVSQTRLDDAVGATVSYSMPSLQTRLLAHRRLVVGVGGVTSCWSSRQTVYERQLRSRVGVTSVAWYCVSELQTRAVEQTRFDDGVGLVDSYSTGKSHGERTLAQARFVVAVGGRDSAARAKCATGV